MKKTLFAVLFCISVFLMIGIVGGVECGESLSNMLWCIPVAVLAMISAVLLESS